MDQGFAGLRREDYRTSSISQGLFGSGNGCGFHDDDLQELELLILSDPNAGDSVSGTAGLRKLRFSPSRWHRGERGALRIGYSHDERLEKVIVLAVYAKNDKSNLSPKERREIKRILDALWRAEGR